MNIGAETEKMQKSISNARDERATSEQWDFLKVVRTIIQAIYNSARKKLADEC